jgi:hypothetical protein
MPYVPILFLLIVEDLSRLVKNVKCRGMLKSIKVSSLISLSHLLFVDEIVLFGEAKDKEWESFKLIMDCFYKVTVMIINVQKSQLLFHRVWDDVEVVILNIFPYPHSSLDNGMKCLNFPLNPNDYVYIDWLWMYQKIEARIMCWCKRWFSRGDRIILVKYVLESIPIYWLSIVHISKGIVDQRQKKCFFIFAEWKKVSRCNTFIEMVNVGKAKGFRRTGT